MFFVAHVWSKQMRKKKRKKKKVVTLANLTTCFTYVALYVPGSINSLSLGMIIPPLVGILKVCKPLTIGLMTIPYYISNNGSLDPIAQMVKMMKGANLYIHEQRSWIGGKLQSFCWSPKNYPYLWATSREHRHTNNLL